MACNFPLYGWQFDDFDLLDLKSCNYDIIDERPDKSRPVTFLSKAINQDMLRVTCSGAPYKAVSQNKPYIVSSDRQLSHIKLFMKTNGELKESLSIPCGKCIQCRLDYSREWANRAVLESLLYDKGKCWFVTLTYEDSQLPLNKFGFPVLRKKDVQAFNKRLREYFSRVLSQSEIRIYYSGEYSPEKKRPHYHLLLFNCYIPDLQYFGTNFQGDIHYISPTIEKLWGHGFIIIGQLTWRTCAYTARYVMKKKFSLSDKLELEKLDIPDVFTEAPRRPGLAVNYFKENYLDIYKNGNIVLPALDSSCSNVIHPPRYFDILYKEINPLHYAKVKSKQKELAQIAEDVRLKSHSLPENEFFKFKDLQASANSKKLLRTLE